MNKDKDEILERVINHYRTTKSGKKVRWDEPDRDDDPEVIRHNAAVANQLKRRKQQQQARWQIAIPTIRQQHKRPDTRKRRNNNECGVL